MKKVDKIITAITALGSVEVKSKSAKYRTFTRPDTSDLYFVGKNGALRTGKNVSDSISLEMVVPMILERYMRAKRKP